MCSTFQYKEWTGIVIYRKSKKERPVADTIKWKFKISSQHLPITLFEIHLNPLFEIVDATNYKIEKLLCFSYAKIYLCTKWKEVRCTYKVCCLDTYSVYQNQLKNWVYFKKQLQTCVLFMLSLLFNLEWSNGLVVHDYI